MKINCNNLYDEKLIDDFNDTIKIIIKESKIPFQSKWILMYILN